LIVTESWLCPSVDYDIKSSLEHISGPRY
jgi:hypothetical protein